MPRAATYGLQFFDRDGKELDTPVRLAGGVALVPLLPGLEAELEGDKWQPSGDWYARPRHRNPPRLPRGR